MAINNTLVQPKQEETKVSVYQTTTGEIKLSPTVIRQYLTNGNGNVTDQECTMFIALCKGQKLNPFIKEAYLIKYGDNQPATMVVSKDVYQKRAENHPQYDGKKAGIIVVDTNGEFKYRDGALCLPNETLVGGWCEVYRKDRKYSERVEVAMSEYMGKKKDGSPNNQWATKPATMIRKVAIAQALRETFPTDLNGMYIEEEMDTVAPKQDVNETPTQIIEQQVIVETQQNEVIQDEM